MFQCHVRNFFSGNQSYINKCIPDRFENILAIESGIGDSWHKFIGKTGVTLTMDTFGLSGTGEDVMEHFGFTVKNIKKKIINLINKNG